MSHNTDQNGKCIKIPIVMGSNRLRGNSVGAMVQDGNDNTLDHLRRVMREEAQLSGIEPTDDWLNTVVAQLLRMYENAHAAWQANRSGTIGHVFESRLPSGKVLLLADERVLARI